MLSEVAPTAKLRYGEQEQSEAGTMGEVFDEIEGFAQALAPMTAVVGLDLGTKTIGVAVSDRLLGSATPLETIKRTKFTADADALLKIMQAREIGGVILGLPRNMDGSEGPRAQSTRAFARNLARLTNAPITFWDDGYDAKTSRRGH